MKRIHEKTAERYDAAVTRFSTLYKFKEASALREVLYDIYFYIILKFLI